MVWGAPQALGILKAPQGIDLGIGRLGVRPFLKKSFPIVLEKWLDLMASNLIKLGQADILHYSLIPAWAFTQ